MTDLEEQVMQLTNDLYVLKHTVIAWKTVEERIKESNTVPESAMLSNKWFKSPDFIFKDWELKEVAVSDH